MERKIVGFSLDDEQHWVAELDCFHRQHVRHDPPLVSRPWVLTEDGRASRLGQVLHCVRCDRFEWPEDLVAYKRTPTFTESTVPKGLLKNHSTKHGVWGKICVLEGRLAYHMSGGDRPVQVITNERVGIIVPEMVHHVAVLESVSFYVEFYARA